MKIIALLLGLAVSSSAYSMDFKKQVTAVRSACNALKKENEGSCYQSSFNSLHSRTESAENRLLLTVVYEGCSVTYKDAAQASCFRRATHLMTSNTEYSLTDIVRRMCRNIQNVRVKKWFGVPSGSEADCYNEAIKSSGITELESVQAGCESIYHDKQRARCYRQGFRKLYK